MGPVKCSGIFFDERSEEVYLLMMVELWAVVGQDRESLYYDDDDDDDKKCRV